MKKRSPRSDWIPTLLLLPATALGQPMQAPEDIRRVAEQFLAAQLPDAGGSQKLFASADALDPRLRLPACTQQPTARLPSAVRVAPRVTVGVSCEQPKWTVYVPVRVETELEVLVLRAAAARSTSLGAADVEPRRMRVAGLPGTYITSVDQLEGRHLRRALPPGTALTAEMLGADILIRRGQRVTLVANAGGIEVRAQGEAIADANAAGRVRVLNLASRKIVEGLAEGPDLVRVSL